MQSPTLAPRIALVAIAAVVGCSDSSSESSQVAAPHVSAVPRWLSNDATAGAAGDPDRGAPAAAGDANDTSGAPRPCPGGQMVLTEDVRNARDLGGVPLRDGRYVACGKLFRGSPLLLSPSGCQELERLAVQTVIDLRIESERSSVPDAACVTADSVHAPLPIPYGLSGEDYLRDLHQTDSLALAFHAFGSPDAYPVYFHCRFGRDRTGVLAALVLLTLGATRETVMQEYLLSKPFVGAYPDALDAVMDEIEMRGGAETVLREAGVTDSEIASLREHAITD